MRINKSKKLSPVFYSIFPPHIGFVAMASAFGSSSKESFYFFAIIYFLVQSLINGVILLLIMFVVLFLTGNRHLTFFKIFKLSLIITFISDAYFYVESYFFIGRPHVISFYFQPEVYFRLSNLVFYPVIMFILFYFFLRKNNINKLFLICILLILLNYPWFYALKIYKAMYQAQSIPGVSQKTTSSLSKGQQLASKIQSTFINEELIPQNNSTQYKQLRIKLNITVPIKGDYNLVKASETPALF